MKAICQALTPMVRYHFVLPRACCGFQLSFHCCASGIQALRIGLVLFVHNFCSAEDGAEHPAAGHLVQELAAQPTAPRLVPDGHPDVQRVTQASATRRTQSPQRQHSNPFV